MKQSTLSCLALLAVSSGLTLVQASPLLVTTTTYFKTSTADSTTLPASEKCLVSAGSKLSADGATTPTAGHYQVSLAAAPAGCGFSSGYFYANDVSWNNWLSGSLATDSKVADAELSALNIGYGGYPLWKSNNPELFDGTGWLMQNSRTDASRGGAPTALANCSNAYLFHINHTGRAAYLHLLATNPNSTAVTLSAKGSIYSNAEKPLTGKATGQSYWTAHDWLTGSYRSSFNNRKLNPYTATEIVKIALNPSNMVDGRYEVCGSQGIYLYSVITYTGTLNDAVSASQSSAAPGQIYSPGTTAFGREAGIYASSLVAGTTEVVLPAAGQYIGFAFNTTAKNSGLQEQTSAATMRLSDSADRTYGNYGHKYDVTLRLYNNDSYAKTVRLSLASSFTAATDSPSFTFNSPATLNGTALDLWTTPTKPRQALATWVIPANSSFDARLVTFIAGLGVTNQQLVLETL